MNKKLYAGISQIVLGILIAIAPQTSLTYARSKKRRWHVITRLRPRSASAS